MTGARAGWPASTLVSLLAALTTWTTLWAWSGFAERPSGFLVPVLAGCLLVALTGMLLRSARLPSLLVALAQLVVLTVWMNHLWAPGLALGGLVPTPSSLHQVSVTIAHASAAAQAYAAPVPKSVTAFYPLLILAGSATAVLVDFLACGLRRVPVAGLPLLALYTAPVSILNDGVSWWKFAVAALSFLFLLASDEEQRLARWGRQVSARNRLFDSQATEVSHAAVWSAARKIGFTATGLAVVVPLFVPTLANGLFAGSGNGPGGHGDAVSISNPMVDMKRDLVRGNDVALLDVTTPGDPSYLRISVLDSFDGNAWRPSGRDIPTQQRAEGALPFPVGLDADVASREVPYTISVRDSFKSNWLPTPYPIASIHASGDWRYDLNTMDFISAADGQTTAGLTYRLHALEVEPTAAELASAGSPPVDLQRTYTALPKSMPESVGNLTRRITDSANTTFQKAVALQDWFRRDGNFTYSLDRAPGNGMDELVKFLGHGPGSRVGYCEQFAAAMALMGRTIGIPSRVAVGFLQPAALGGNTYVYSSHDLHAWPEMYFQGVGWTRFEPTPQSRATAVPAYTRQPVRDVSPAAPVTSLAPHVQQNRIDKATPAAGASGSGGGGSWFDGGALRVGALVVVALLALLAVPRLLRRGVRRRRWSSADDPVALAEAAWSELRDTALDLRLPWDDSVTLRRRAADLVRSFGRAGADADAPRGARPHTLGATADPAATQALDRVVRFVERARYSRSMGAPAVGASTSVSDDVAVCVAALMAGATRHQRLLATWLPASLATGLRPRGQAGGRGRQPLVRPEVGVDHAV